MARRPTRPNPHLSIARVERQHRLIEELRARAPRFVPGEVLGSNLGISVRTVERDIAQLVAAGIPVDVRRGPGGGYAIDARSKLPPVVLTPGEAAAIISALVAIGPYSSAAARSALAKMVKTLTT
jgi:predicted DNA-binding transcriptional regulator YafY